MSAHIKDDTADALWEALDPWRRVYAVSVKPFLDKRREDEGIGPLLPLAWPTVGDLKRLATLSDRAIDQSDEMQAAVSFCYAILAPGQDANAILRANPERRVAAHRAIYERKPHDDSYDAMTARIAALDDHPPARQPIADLTGEGLSAAERARLCAARDNLAESLRTIGATDHVRPRRDAVEIILAGIATMNVSALTDAAKMNDLHIEVATLTARLAQAEVEAERMREAIETAVKLLRAPSNWVANKDFIGDIVCDSRLLIATQLEEAIDGTYSDVGEEVRYDREGPR